MYLQIMKDDNVSHTNWPKRTDTEKLTALFDVAEVIVSNRTDLQDDLERMQGDAPEVTNEAFLRFTHTVQAVAVNNDFPRTSKYQAQCVAYALLRQWIEQRAAVAAAQPEEVTEE